MTNVFLDLSSIDSNNKNLNYPFKINCFDIIKNIDEEELINQLGIKEVVTYKGDQKKVYSIEDYMINYQKNDFEWYASNINVYNLLHLKLPYFLKSWTDFLPKEIRLEWLWVFIGPKNSYTSTHIDIMNSSAWNLLLSGEKEWTFYPPNSQVSKDLLPNDFSPTYNNFPEKIHFIQQPGDMVFTPSSWAHNVYNQDPTISITGNCINKTNIYEAMDYLKSTKNDKWYKVLNYLKDEFTS